MLHCIDLSFRKFRCLSGLWLITVLDGATAFFNLYSTILRKLKAIITGLDALTSICLRNI